MVYVDTPFRPRSGFCYMMVADSTIELLDMAYKLGLSADWIEEPGTYREHYKLSLKRQRRAIHYGAKLLTAHEMGTFLVNRRNERGEECLTR